MSSKNRRKKIDGIVKVTCKFYKPGQCNFKNGTTCIHGIPHDVLLSKDVDARDICSGFCMHRNMQTWCVMGPIK